MLDAWWTQFLAGLGNYVIQPGSANKVMVTTTRITNLGYTYAIHRINNIPEIDVTVINLLWLSTRTTSSFM